MVRIGRILRDYQDAGSVNGLLALWGFVDDTTFLTKAGHVGRRLPGARRRLRRSVACPAAGARPSVRSGAPSARRALPRLSVRAQADRVARSSQAPAHQPIANEAIQRRAAYLNGRRHDLYDLSLYLVLLYEPPHAFDAAPDFALLEGAARGACALGCRPTTRCALIESDLDRAVGTLHHKAQGFEVQISDIGPARLRKQEAFRFFRELVNYDTRQSCDAARLTHDTHLDYFVSDSAVECHRDHLLVGDRVVKVLTMKEPPSQTFAYLLQDLYAIPGEFIACLEWQRISERPHASGCPDPPAALLQQARVDRELRRRRRLGRRRCCVDDSANTTVRQLGDALTELEVNGHFFGNCSLTLVLHGTDPRALQHQTAEAMKAMAVHDGSLFEETYNLLNAWLAIVPGNGAHNLRRLALLETNLADLSFLFTLDHGEPVSPHLRREALAVFETPHRHARTPSTCTFRTSGTRSCWARPAAARAFCSTS